MTLVSGIFRARLGFLALLLGLAACQQSPDATAGDLTPASGETAGGHGARNLTVGDEKEARSTTVERLSVKILATYPHDPGAFTQGLVWDGGVLYESTGLYGKSSLRRVEPMSGEGLDRRAVDPNLFAEGLAMVGDRLVQLTWKAGIALVYDLATLELVDEYGFNGEGWGLAYDGNLLVMSDGSHRLTLRDSSDLRWRVTVEVQLGGKKVENINELELVDGDLYANVWGEERIIRLDPETGVVDGVIDCSGLLEASEKSRVDVLNGIAYDPVSETFWLTGKFWPRMFQVVFVPV